MTDEHNTTWTSAPSHLDDCYWRRIFAAHIMAAIFAGDRGYRVKIEELYNGLEVFAQTAADELVRQMNKTDRRES